LDKKLYQLLPDHLVSTGEAAHPDVISVDANAKYSCLALKIQVGGTSGAHTQPMVQISLVPPQGT